MLPGRHMLAVTEYVRFFVLTAVPTTSAHHLSNCENRSSAMEAGEEEEEKKIGRIIS